MGKLITIIMIFISVCVFGQRYKTIPYNANFKGNVNVEDTLKLTRVLDTSTDTILVYSNGVYYALKSGFLSDYATQTNVNQLGDSLRSELTDTASAVRQFAIDNRNYYDVTICASGCDYSDLSTAFSTEPSGTSFFVANETFNENTQIDLYQDHVYWDGTIIRWGTSSGIEIHDSCSFAGSLKISCTTASAGGNHVIDINGNYNMLHPCPIYFSIEDTMSKSRFFDIDGSFNTVNTILDTGLVFSSTGSLGAFFAIDGDGNRVSLNYSETQHTATPSRSILNCDGDYNIIDIIAVNNKTAAGVITGVTLSALSNYNCVRGISYGNSTNLTDGGSGNNTTGLIAP